MATTNADHPRSRGVYSASMSMTPVVPGSSPLARGLLLSRLLRLSSRRIIPARAGFTPSRSGVGCVCWDHPRSRGVYHTDGRRSYLFSGSSPLARGLPVVAVGVCGAPRIIPARAGFILELEPSTEDTRDHPRSRGVYSFVVSVVPTRSGSSPLARGLQPCGPDRQRHVGIIPARAGFTASRPKYYTNTWDHPRSRGVYARFGAFLLRRAGSSPLARGLQVDG